jgi:hypothetical protein
MRDSFQSSYASYFCWSLTIGGKKDSAHGWENSAAFAGCKPNLFEE